MLASHCGLERDHPHRQPIADGHPWRNKNDSPGNLELYFQNRKAFINKAKNPISPSTPGQLVPRSQPRAGGLSS